MKTTGTLLPEVRAALRRGDCAGARILIGDAQRGHLSARQQTTVRRLLQTVERCDIRHGVAGARRAGGPRQPRAKYVFIEYRAGSYYYGANHPETEIQAVKDQARRRGATSIAIDDVETTLGRHWRRR